MADGIQTLNPKPGIWTHTIHIYRIWVLPFLRNDGWRMADGIQTTPDTSKGGLRKIECDLPRDLIGPRLKRHLRWSAVIRGDLLWSAVICCDLVVIRGDLLWSDVICCYPYLPRGSIRNWQVDLPRGPIRNWQVDLPRGPIRIIPNNYFMIS